MKSKKLKKLTFKKETISNLNSFTMAKVYGGDNPPTATCTCTCESVCPEKCPRTDPGTTGDNCLWTLYICP